MERKVRKALSTIGENVWKRLSKEPKRPRLGLASKDLIDVPEDGDFWDRQRGAFLGVMGGETNGLLMEGIDQASRLGLAVDFEMANQQVLEYASTFNNEWWGKLSGTTRDGLRTAIRTHIESGEPFPVLRKNLTPLFGRTRAEMVAATETTRLFAEGNRIAYRQAGVAEVELRSCADASVCESCGGLDGERFPIDRQDVVPPLHPRCRCWLAPVVDGSARSEPVD